MATKSKSIPHIVSGAGMFLNLITVLTGELKRVGGLPEMLCFAQMEHARPLMGLLAKTIVESGLWKIPLSLIMEEIESECDKSNRHSHTDLAKKWNWHNYSVICRRLTILRFSCNPDSVYVVDNELMTIGIPQELVAVAGIEHCGTVISYKGKRYVITCSVSGSNRAIFLAPAEYLDLDG